MTNRYSAREQRADCCDEPDVRREVEPRRQFDSPVGVTQKRPEPGHGALPPRRHSASGDPFVTAGGFWMPPVVVKSRDELESALDSGKSQRWTLNEATRGRPRVVKCVWHPEVRLQRPGTVLARHARDSAERRVYTGGIDEA